MQHTLILKLVEEIARAGSIRSAADRMAITPSALNRRLLALEAELNTQIFERRTNGVVLNAAGEIFVAHARRQLADVERVQSQIADLKGARRGRVALSVDPSVKSDGMFSAKVAEYRAAFPGVSFAIEAQEETALTAAMVDYQSDLALQFHPRANPALQSLSAAPATIVAVGRPGHPRLTGAPLRLHDLVECPLILPRRGPLRSLLDTAARQQGVPLTVVIEAELGFGAATLRASDAIGFEIDTGRASEDGFARQRLSDKDLPRTYIHLSQLRGRTLSVAAGRFAEHVKQAFAALLDDPF